VAWRARTTDGTAECSRSNDDNAFLRLTNHKKDDGGGGGGDDDL